MRVAGGTMACLRALAAVCYAVLLATTVQATALSRGGKNNHSFSRRLARLSAGETEVTARMIVGV